MTLDEWADVMMEALRNSDDGNNPFYSDDEDTISLARQLAEAVVAQLACSQSHVIPAGQDETPRTGEHPS